MRRSALFIDFDNFFGGLLGTDPAAALRAVENPGPWLRALATGLDAAHPTRRWLLLRCYLNPGGSVQDPRDPSKRIYFSTFRPFFTQAGIEVVDCPSLTRGAKNGADIRIVVDAIENREGARAEAVMREHSRLAARNLRLAIRNRTHLDLLPALALLKSSVE